MTLSSRLAGFLMCTITGAFSANAFADEPAPRVTVLLRADSPLATLERRESVATYAG